MKNKYNNEIKHSYLIVDTTFSDDSYYGTPLCEYETKDAKTYKDTKDRKKAYNELNKILADAKKNKTPIKLTLSYVSYNDDCFNNRCMVDYVDLFEVEFKSRGSEYNKFYKEVPFKK